MQRIIPILWDESTIPARVIKRHKTEDKSSSLKNISVCGCTSGHGHIRMHEGELLRLGVRYQVFLDVLVLGPVFVIVSFARTSLRLSVRFRS